jgi:hypothetical protein
MCGSTTHERNVREGGSPNLMLKIDLLLVCMVDKAAQRQS